MTPQDIDFHYGQPVNGPAAGVAGNDIALSVTGDATVVAMSGGVAAIPATTATLIVQLY